MNDLTPEDVEKLNGQVSNPFTGDVGGGGGGGTAAPTTKAPLTPRQNPGWWGDYFQMMTPREGIGYDTNNQDLSRQLQDQLLQQLHAQAQGDPNSYAQTQLRLNTQQAQGQVAGSMAARGNMGGAGAGMRFAGQAQGALGRQGQDASQVLKLQEQQAAQALMAQMYQQQQAQDAALGQGKAQTALGNYGLDDSLQQGAYQGAVGGMLGQWQTSMDRARDNLDLETQNQALNLQMLQQMGGTASGAASTAAAIPWSTPTPAAGTPPPMPTVDPETLWDDPYRGGG